MEDLNAGLQQDIIKPNSGSKFLWLAKIIVPTKETQAYSKNTEEVTYDSTAWQPMAMEVGGQSRSGEGEIPEVVLQVTRLNQVLYEIVASTQGAVGGQVELIKVNSDYLDPPIPALAADFALLAAQSDSEWMTFTLGVPSPLNQPFPLLSISSSQCPYNHPSLFKGPKCQYAGGDTVCDGTYEDCKSKGNEENWGGEMGMDPSGMGL